MSPNGWQALRTVAFFVAVLGGRPTTLWGQEPVGLGATSESDVVVRDVRIEPWARPTPAGSRWAYIVCGHPGDESHEESFGDSIASMVGSVVTELGFPAEHVWLRLGSQRLLDRLSGLQPAATVARGVSTVDGLKEDLGQLSSLVDSRAELWVVVLGHATRRREGVFLNLPGLDMSVAELGRACESLGAGRQLFLVTTPMSGHFMKPLARADRIIISATAADIEVNETDYPHALARYLSELKDRRADFGDRGPTVLDLHIGVARTVLAGYSERGHLVTEHAMLDDNGDGRGTEVQLDYLPIELGGRVDRAERGLAPGADGYRSSTTPLYALKSGPSDNSSVPAAEVRSK